MSANFWKMAPKLLLVLLSGLFFRCSDNPVSAPRNSFSLTTAEKVLIESDNKFGLKLFQKIAQAEGHKNVFISPLSIAMSLGMAYNGAEGGTAVAMQEVLELSGLSIEEVNISYKRLMNALTELDPSVQFQVANSLWYRGDFQQPRTGFLNVCVEYFNALVTGLNFNDPNAASIINTWVEESTDGRIEEIVDNPINPRYVMVLINAIYFNGEWTYKFDEDLTFDDWFYLPDGSQTACSMMQQRGSFEYYFHEDFKVLDLPYGDGAFRMTIFLPARTVGLDSLMAQFGLENFDQELMRYWLSSFSRDSLDIFIPKFTLEYESGLKDILATLGMGVAFTEMADFTKMYADGGVWIDQVKHKAFVEVNEEGTEAAAATSTIVTSGMDGVFWADHPFLFMIRENHSQTILFMGKVVDPTGG